jgi:hypothetical protein
VRVACCAASQKVMLSHNRKSVRGGGVPPKKLENSRSATAVGSHFKVRTSAFLGSKRLISTSQNGLHQQSFTRNVIIRTQKRYQLSAMQVRVDGRHDVLEKQTAADDVVRRETRMMI